MDATAYLERINAKVGSTDLQYLRYLQQQHLCHIPFENLDVL
ncbi:arylamine N-acetyltransferase [Alicyclobacillus pomorum]